MNRIKKAFNTCKEFLLVSMAVVAIGVITLLLLPADKAQAQPAAGGLGYYNPKIAINSSSTTATNAHFGVTTNGVWPVWVIGGDIVTNFTPVDVSQYKEVSIQLSGSANASTGAAAAQTVILTVYRSLGGPGQTNSVGTGLFYDTLGTITLTNIASSTGPWTVISNYTSGNGSPIAGAQTLYLGKLDCTGLTNGVFLTNYTVRVSGK